MHRAALAVAAALLLLAAAPPAAANGRNPGTSTLHFRAGHESDIVAGMTFGLLVSHDAGATWQWMCEDAVGYGGLYDPTYVYAATGTLFATTFSGLRAERDGCTFAPLASGSAFASTDAQGPDGAYFYGASSPADAKIYKSTDDGVTFGSGVTPPNGLPNDWWQSITVAPSDPTRVYLFGYRFDAQNVKSFLLYKSVDGGATFTTLPATGFTTSPNSAIEVVGIDKTNPDIVYAHVTQQDGMALHGLYRSANGGASWTPIYSVSDRAFAFVRRGNGDLVVGSQLGGLFVSTDQGAHWTVQPNAPHVNCLVENSAGEIWACTQNYSVMGGPPSDHAGIMKSTDAAAWTAVLKYEDIQAPVSCAAGTPQHDTCQVNTWCGLKMQLGITSTVLDCAAPIDQPPALEAPVLMPPAKSGCCDTTGDPGGLVLGAGLALLWWRGKHQSKRRIPC